MKTTATISIDKPNQDRLDSHIPLTKWENEPTVRMLTEDLNLAKPDHDADVIKIDRWIKLRDAERVKNDKNRSGVQPKLVRKQAEWRYSALSEPFLSSERLFDISPVGWEDKTSAEQNQLLLNNQFSTKIPKVAFIDEYVRTAVDEGTVVLRPGWYRETKMEDVEVPVWDYYAIESPAEFEELQQAIYLHQENPQGYEQLSEDMKAAVEYTLEMQRPVVAQQKGTQIVQEERVVKNHPTVDIIDYRNCYIDPNCNGDIKKANFAIISFETSKAELTRDGRYSNLDQVLWSSNTPLNTPDHETRADNSQQFNDELRKRVVAYEYWGFYDIHKTGVLVPIVATWIGNVMIRMEENPYPDKGIPLVIVKYMPVRKKVTGEPDAELLEDNQNILGALVRGMIDLMGRSANGQTGFAKGMLDVVNRRRYDRGQDYEYNPSLHPDAGIYAHKYPEIPQSALVMLQQQNQEAESLTGVKAFSGGLSGEAYGQVAAGIRGMLDASAKREMAILRRLAAGMEELGRKIMAMNAVFLSDEEIIGVTNDREIAISREALFGEHNLKVDISTTEIEEAKAQDLGFLLQTLGNSVPFDITKRILIQIAKLKRMPELAKMLEEYEPQPDPLTQLEQQKLQLEIEKLRAEAATEQAEAQERIAKAMKLQAEARSLGSQADKMDLDFIEQETGTTHAREMDQLGAQAAANERLEIRKKQLELLGPDKSAE